MVLSPNHCVMFRRLNETRFYSHLNFKMFWTSCVDAVGDVGITPANMENFFFHSLIDVFI